MGRGATERVGTIGLLRGWDMVGVECASRWVDRGVSLVRVSQQKGRNNE